MDEAAGAWRGSIDLGLPGTDSLHARPLVPLMRGHGLGARPVPAGGTQDEQGGVGRQGRVCAAPGCGTVLSVYNPSRYCSLHEPEGVLPLLRRGAGTEATIPEWAARRSLGGRRTADGRREDSAA